MVPSSLKSGVPLLVGWNLTYLETIVVSVVGQKIIRCFCPVAVEFLYCDLASLKSIRQFVQTFKKKKIPLHVLVNNGESWGNQS